MPQSARFGEAGDDFFFFFHLTLAFLPQFLFTSLFPKQARPVAVQARPAAWCPGLDAPAHLTGT